MMNANDVLIDLLEDNRRRLHRVHKSTFLSAAAPSGECFPYSLHSTTSRLPFWGIFLSHPLHNRTYVLN